MVRLLAASDPPGFDGFDGRRRESPLPLSAVTPVVADGSGESSLLLGAGSADFALLLVRGSLLDLYDGLVDVAGAAPFAVGPDEDNGTVPSLAAFCVPLGGPQGRDEVNGIVGRFGGTRRLHCEL